MSGWYSKNLGDAMLAQSALQSIEKDCAAIIAQEKHRPDLTAFTRHESEGRLHCELVVYFSPAFRAYAKSLGATPCKKPSGHGLSILSGSDSTFDRFSF